MRCKRRHADKHVLENATARNCEQRCRARISSFLKTVDNIYNRQTHNHSCPLQKRTYSVQNELAQPTNPCKYFFPHSALLERSSANARTHIPICVAQFFASNARALVLDNTLGAFFATSTTFCSLRNTIVCLHIVVPYVQ